MKNKYKKKLIKVFSVFVSLLMVFALVPTTVSADSSQTIYNDPSTGININVNSDDLGVTPMNVTFIVVVDGENKQQITLSDITQTLSYLNINAEGYNISCEGDGISATQGINNKWNLQILRDNSTLTINLISEKTKDDITISDYGTFHWMKGEATTAAFSRQLTVYVNDEKVYEQTIYTPQNLNNSGSNAQYWFTPFDSYNDEVTYNHPLVLDMVANRNLEVYLTTKCPCGQDYCECPGGNDCTCEEGCTCELCNPAQGATEIRTPYGVIEYKKPSGSGYNLTVETYVNGVLKHTTDQLRIRAGEIDCLNYTPSRGYYYFNDQNSYDLITDGASSWDQRTGYIMIVGDRDDDNILKVYLWTFENHSKLDVERRLDVDDNVTGYMISYEAYNPETKQNETFTYQATSFLLAQSQMIPIGTDVTITAICNSPYEVSQWSTADAYSAVELTGAEGQNGTEAYGNSATINVTSTAYTSVTVYIDDIRKVELPTEEDLVNNPENYFDDGTAIIVDCITNEGHPDGKYGLKAGTFNIGQLEGSSNEGYTTTLTITQPNEYINDYVSANGEHTRNDDNVKVIDLQWVVVDGKSQWKAVEPATYEVQCETDPGTTIPEKPDEPTVEDLLKDNAVTIDCINNKVNHDDKTYGLLGEYTIGEVTGNATQGYTVDITVTPDAYVTKYNTDTKVTHELSPSTQGQKIIQLEYDETDGWVAKKISEPVVYTVVCETDPGTTTPEKPTDDQVKELLKDKAVTIECINNKVDHADRTYGLLDGYTVSDVKGSEADGYTVDVTVTPDAYVAQYNTDTGVDHVLSPDTQGEEIITLVYVDGQWALEEGYTPVTFTVICDSDSGDQTDPSDPTNPDDDNPVNPGGDDGNQGGNDNTDDGNGNNTGNTNDNGNNSGNTNNNGNGNNAGQNGNQNVNNGNTTNGNGAGTNGTTSSTNSSQNPKTSDDSAIVTWMSLVVLAAGGIAVITKKTLKKNK